MRATQGRSYVNTSKWRSAQPPYDTAIPAKYDGPPTHSYTLDLDFAYRDVNSLLHSRIQTTLMKNVINSADGGFLN